MCLLNIIKNHHSHPKITRRPPYQNVCLPLPPTPARTHCGSSLSLPLCRERLRSCVPSNITAHPHPCKPSPAPRMDEASALSSTSPRPPASSQRTAHHQHFIPLHGTCAFVSQTQRDFFVHLVGNRGPSRDPLACILASCRHAPCASHRPGLRLGQAGAHLSKPWSPRRSGHPEGQAGEGPSARASAGSTGRGVRHTHHSRRASAKAQKEECPLTGGCSRRRNAARRVLDPEGSAALTAVAGPRWSPWLPVLLLSCVVLPLTSIWRGALTPPCSQDCGWEAPPRATPKPGLTQLLPGGL